MKIYVIDVMCSALQVACLRVLCARCMYVCCMLRALCVCVLGLRTCWLCSRCKLMCCDCVCYVLRVAHACRLLCIMFVRIVRDIMVCSMCVSGEGVRALRCCVLRLCGLRLRCVPYKLHPKASTYHL